MLRGQSLESGSVDVQEGEQIKWMNQGILRFQSTRGCTASVGMRENL